MVCEHEEGCPGGLRRLLGPLVLPRAAEGGEGGGGMQGNGHGALGHCAGTSLILYFILCEMCVSLRIILILDSKRIPKSFKKNCINLTA